MVKLIKLCLQLAYSIFLKRSEPRMTKCNFPLESLVNQIGFSYSTSAIDSNKFGFPTVV